MNPSSGAFSCLTLQSFSLKTNEKGFSLQSGLGLLVKKEVQFLNEFVNKLCHSQHQQFIYEKNHYFFIHTSIL
jgi:hypothetical protein